LLPSSNLCNDYLLLSVIVEPAVIARRTRGRALALLVLAAPAVQAQTPDPNWDVTKPRGKPVEIDFTTSEGTWMSTDITPDGRWIVFNLLGHIYRVPATGGEAECLTQETGIAVNFHPRISPDGSTIAFISDRNGQNNIWLMDIDGKNPRAVTQELAGRFLEPTWSPDGRYLVARRIDAVNLFQVSVMMFHKDGGQGTTLLRIENNLFPGGPKISPDGRHLYYQSILGPVNGYFSRNDVLQGDAQIRRLDLQTGRTDQITTGHLQQQDHSSSGGGYGPELSPDGRYLAFARRLPDGLISYKGKVFGPRTALWIRDLETGAERLAMDPIEVDFTEGLGPVDQVIPGYRWTADGRSIVISQGGKIRRLDVATGAVSTIPFTARVRRTATERVVASRRVPDGPLEIKFPRWHSPSPDGRMLAFQAVGRIWLMDLPAGTPRRLTPESFAPQEYQPAWSPDGRSIAFVGWNDAERGAVYRAPVSGGTPVRVTPNAGEYLEPSWSGDGRTLVVARGSGASARGQGLGRSNIWDLVSLPADGGQETLIGRIGGGAVRAAVAQDRVWYAEPAQGGPLLVSVRMDGSDRREHLKVTNATELQVSPDAMWVGIIAGGNAYVTPMPPLAYSSAVLTVGRTGGPLPVTRLSTTGALTVRWRDAGTLTYGSGTRFVSWTVASKRADTTTIRLTVPRDLPNGTIAFTNGRLLTMDNGRVISRGSVVIRAGRIACVGSCNTSGADRVVNLQGRTVLPGLVDMHAHHHGEQGPIQPAHDFASAIYLAYGVTTSHNPAAPSLASFPAAELVEAGGSIGPRMFSTAETFGSADNPGTNTFDNAEGAYQEAARRVEWGAVSLKEYLQPDRRRRQWVVEAGRRLGVMVTSEGSIDIDHKVSLALDGHTGFEHATAQTPLYSDFTTFLGKLGSVYSATPLVGGPGPWNEEYFWQESDVWKDAKAQRWLPWRQLIPHTRRRILRPRTDYSFPIMTQAVADIVAAGGGTAIGSHGQQHGLGSHWDIWMYAASMGNMGALEAATIHGARFLGMEQDLGSISVGKLGDLVVLNGDPLTNIRATADIRYVVKGGVMYDANSLDELWPRQRPFGDYYWYVPEIYRSDVRPVDYHDRQTRQP
jgi:Tol biopolymer transport system component